MTDIPTFKVKAEGEFLYAPGTNGKQIKGCHLVFECPLCENINVHGGTFGVKGDGDGHRVSHCGCWPDGYYIKEVS